MFDCELWSVLMWLGSDVFFYVGVPKNLGFCGVSVMVVVVAVGFWWLG